MSLPCSDVASLPLAAVHELRQPLADEIVPDE